MIASTDLFDGGSGQIFVSGLNVVFLLVFLLTAIKSSLTLNAILLELP